MHDPDFKAIGKKIREVRISKGLTQEFLASAADVNPSHISNIENNRVKISLTTLINVCNAMEVTVDYILSGEYITSSALERSILRELQKCDEASKERILKIIQVLE